MTVSVCVPTIGRPYLSETLASAVRQSLTPLEIVVLDNADDGGSAEVVHRYAVQHANIRHSLSAKRLGMHENFNRALTDTSGEFIAFMHDDDVYHHDFLEQSVALLRAHPRVGFVGSNCLQINADGRVMRARSVVGSTRVAQAPYFIRDIFRAGRSPLSLPGIVFRRDALTAHPFPPTLERHHGDLVHIMRIAESWDVGLIATPLWSSRVHGGSFTQSIPAAAALLTGLSVFQEYQLDLERRGLDYVSSRDMRRLADRMAGLAWLQSTSPEDEALALTALSEHGSMVMRAFVASATRVRLRRALATLVPTIRWVTTKLHE